MTETLANYQAAAMVLAGITSLCISANAIIGVLQKIASIRAMRNPARSPPLGEESAKTYATKRELAELRTEWRGHCARTHELLGTSLGEIYDLLRQYEARNGEWQRSVSTQLGSLHEGLDNLKRRKPQ